MDGTDRARRRSLQLRRAIPRLLAAVLLVDLALRVVFAFRVVSIDPLTFRPSDALLAYRPVGATYEANRQYYYLNRLERALRAMGVPVLNLTPLLSAEAARQLKHGRYLYWPDDVHWNARGIALAAAAIQETWPLPEWSCCSPHLQARKGP